MNAAQLVDEGRLTPAIELLTQELKAQPTDLGRRALLFDLLCYAGELDRAGRQLDALERIDSTPKTHLGVEAYRSLLMAERKRIAWFEAGEPPTFLLEPPEHVQLHVQAHRAGLAGDLDRQKALLAEAEAARPEVKGTAAGQPFDDVRDADDLLAPVLELFMQGAYVWVPWEHIQFLEPHEPERLRDLLWASARFATPDGQLGEVHLPCLYPASARSTDDLVRLGRQTDWVDHGGIVRGVGLKTLLVGSEARTLLELGALEISVEPPSTSGE